MSALAFDIETHAPNLAELREENPVIADYLKGRAMRNAAEDLGMEDATDQDVEQRLCVFPPFAQVSAIGLWRVGESTGGAIVVNGMWSGNANQWSQDTVKAEFDESVEFRYFGGSEAEVLTEFWRVVANSGQLVTYNGRGFDAPVIILRSLQLGVEIQRDLMPYRYGFQDHCDLQEALTFWRSCTAAKLDYWCHAFGVPSPKSGKVRSEQAQLAWAHGEVDLLAELAVADAKATAALYQKCQPILYK